jgi:ribonuclease D
VTDPDTAWWKVKGASTMRGEKARVAQAVAAWRDRRAQRLDVPGRFVLSELALAAVVNRPPRNADDVKKLRGISGLPGGAVRELLDAVETGRALDPELLRRPPKHEELPELDAAVSLLSAWVTELATTERIDKKLLATRDDVKDLVYGRPCRLDQGWRATLCGQGLRKVLSGDAVVRLVDGGRHLRLEGLEG